MRFHPKYLSGLAAVGIYIGIVGVVFYYFGYHTKQPNTHFVTQNSNAIAVTLQAPRTTKKPRHKAPKPAPKPKPKKSKHTKPKPMVAQKPAKPKPAKKKPAKKKPAKKIKAKSLFADIKTKPKPKPKKSKTPAKPKPATKSTKASKQSRDALKKQHARDKGIENRYLASIQERLYGWPAQSNFAGATLTIGLTIHPDGRFDYTILTPSANPEFNRTIDRYLQQLQKIGFDPTPKGKPYSFRVDIVAK